MIENIKINLSKNGIFISNLVTNLLLLKNLPLHYKLLKESYYCKIKNNQFFVKDKIDSPYKRLKQLCIEHPEIMNKDAIIQDKKITYQEMIDQIDKLSNYLASLNVKKGENISICAESSIEGIISFFAMNSLGAVNARIFTDSKEINMKDNILNFNSKIIFVDENNISVLSHIISETNIKNIILTSEINEKTLSDFLHEHPEINIITWDKIMSNDLKIFQNKKVDVYANDMASILYTSGSSGEPKPIMFPNRSYTNMADIVKMTTNEKIANFEKVASVVSHEYPYAANNSTVMVLLLGKTLVMPNNNNISIAQMLKNKVNKIQAIPIFYKMLSSEITSDKLSIDEKMELINNLSYLDYIVAGGEPYQKSEKKDLLTLLIKLGYAPLLIDGFGFGELGSAAALKFGLCEYFLLMNGIEAMTINANTGKKNKKGEEGFLCFSSPTITSGYYNNEEATKKSFVQDENGKLWFVSDTYGTVHGIGNRLIKLNGRVRECFITSNKHGNFVKVYSGNVEDVIFSSGIIDDCIVVQSGFSQNPTPVAIVSMKKDCNLSEESIKKIIQEKCETLEDFSKPSKIEIQETIKRTPADKKDYEYYREKYSKVR